MPYDGANPQYQDLYHFPAEPGDKEWYSNNPRWQKQWFGAIKELVDHYHPDLLYTDGGVAFGNEMGYSLIAHLYNDRALPAELGSGPPDVVLATLERRMSAVPEEIKVVERELAQLSMQWREKLSGWSARAA